MMDLLLQGDRAASLARFADLDPAGGGVAFAVHQAIDPLRDLVGVDRIDLVAPSWDPTGCRWLAMLQVDLRTGSDQIHTVEIPVPWLVDDSALHGTPAGVVLGAHDGTYLGRPRYPIAVLSRRPGVRFLLRPARDRIRVIAEMVPDLGVTWRLESVNTRNVKVQLSGDGVVEKAGLRRFTPAEISGVAAFIAKPKYPSVFRPDTLDTAMGALEGGDRVDRGASVLTHTDLALVITLLQEYRSRYEHWNPDTGVIDPPASVTPQMHPNGYRARQYGDLLIEAAYHGVTRAVHRITDPGSRRAPDAIAVVLGRYLQGEFAALGAGAGRYAAAVLSDRPVNTVARVETGRQLSFIGPGGFPDNLSGRMDLRVLPDAWRNSLCPVHTPESTKVGLIRHAALAAVPTGAGDQFSRVAGEYGDLSVAAALVPFVNHDDPTRTSIGSKMFKQALHLVRPEPPIVRTGMEELVAEAAGIARAGIAGSVESVHEDRVIVDGRPFRFGPPLTDGTGQQHRWLPRVATGDWVNAGDILAHSPDVEVSTAVPCLQLGLNALTAFLPWNGWNYEDGIVVSESFAQRMTSQHVVRVTAELTPPAAGTSGDYVMELIGQEELTGQIPAGRPVVAMLSDTGATMRTISFPETSCLVPARNPGGYTYLAHFGDEIAVQFMVLRPAQVGDKLTTRHGGKGVITKILPDQEMPRLPDHSVVEVLLNPIGVLRRLNIGVLLEMNAALARRLRRDPNPIRVGRRLGRTGRTALAEELTACGAPAGRLPLTLADGTPVGPAEGVSVGELYLLKLHHQAKTKASGRPDAGPSPTTFQPATSSGWGPHRHLGRPQRLGEMELWGLQVIGAGRVLQDLLRHRGVGAHSLRDEPILAAGFRAVAGNLAVAGLHLEGDLAPGIIDLTTHPDTDPAAVSKVLVRWRGDRSTRRGLRNLEAVFREEAVNQIQSDSTPRRGIRKAEPGVTTHKLARRLMDLMLSELLDESETQTTRYEIVLARPVGHPWQLKVGRGLPELHSVAVLPVAAFQGSVSAQPGTAGDLRRLYEELLVVNLSLQALLSQPATGPGDVQSVRQDLSRAVRALLGNARSLPSSGTVAGRLNSKYGLLRRNLLGSAAIRSGRAVLTANPGQDIETVGLPRWLMTDLGIDRGDTPVGFDNIVLLNRQPTLHPYNLVALRATESPEDTICLHPYLLTALAGDFDGDTAAVHRPVSAAARAELWALARPAATLRNANNGGLLAKLDLDIAVGLRCGTAEPADRSTLSQDLRLPRPIDQVLDPAGITRTAETIVGRSRDPATALRGLGELMLAGWARAAGWGFSLLDLPDLTARGPAISDAQAQQHLLAALGAAAGDPTAALTRIAQAFGAGAAGQPVDLAQLLIRRGAPPTPNVLLRTSYVAESLLDGVQDRDYFNAAQPSVGTLAAKKLVTPFAGALTKTLVELGYEMTVGGADCGARGGARSPISCADHAPCQACCRTDPATGRPMPTGRRVGLLAGMLIGEKSTQLAMKSIHQRGTNSTLTGTITELSGVFGRGRFPYRPLAETAETAVFTRLCRTPGSRRVDGPRPVIMVSLLNVFNAMCGENDTAGALAPVVRRFGDLLGDKVAPVYAEVLLRRLLDAYRLAAGTSTVPVDQAAFAGAVLTGRSALNVASTRGDLRGVIVGSLRDHAGTELPQSSDAHLRRLITGAPVA